MYADAPDSWDYPDLFAIADDSPIRWKVKLETGKGTLHCTALIDPGAHGLFLSSHIAQKRGLEIKPLPSGSAARLPDGTLLPIAGETDRFQLSVGRQFKAQESFKVLPLAGYDVILGIPFLHKHKIKLDFTDKTAHLKHRNRQLCIYPANPYYQLDFNGDPFWDLVQQKTTQKHRQVRINPSSGPQKPQPHLRKQIHKQLKSIRKTLSQQLPEPMQTKPKTSDLNSFSTDTIEMCTSKQFRKSLKRAKHFFALYLIQSPDSSDVLVTASNGTTFPLSALATPSEQIAETLSNLPDCIPSNTKENFAQVLHQFADFLSDDGELRPPPERPPDINLKIPIDLKPGSRPPAG